MKYLLRDNMKKTLFIFGFIISLISCGEEEPYIFVTQYNLSSTVAFDFTKNYSAKIGTVTFLNKENKKKKWRYIYHAPRACLYNKKTKECDESAGMSLVSHNPDPETVDSVFWALLGSATSHTPVKPYGSTKVTLFINLNFYPRPKELIQNIKKNHQHLEYHIFIRSGAVISQDLSGPPDFIIQSIKVIY